MKIEIRGIEYAYEWANGFCYKLPTLVCLHGFMGTGESFKGLAQSISNYNLLLVDLIGHGKSETHVHPYRFTTESQVEDLNILFNRLELKSVSLIGYSMGGRLALSYATSYPDRIDYLCLESTTPGLALMQDRISRMNSDRLKAARLMQFGLPKFVEEWERLPLFNSQKKLSKEIQTYIKSERLSQNAYGMAASLCYFGTGIQPSNWDRLNRLSKTKVMLIVGEQDIKFISINQKMHQMISGSQLKVVKNCGHCVHLENPLYFNTLVQQLLQL